MEWVLGTIAVGLLAARWLDMSTRGKRARKAWDAGMQALEAGEMADAETAFRRVVRLMPAWGPAKRMLGRVLSWKGDYAEAEGLLRMASQLEPRDPAGLVDLGMFLALCPPQRPEEAIQSFERAVELAPDLRKRLAETGELDALRHHDQFLTLIGETQTK